VEWSPLQAILLSGSLYVVWQTLYWKFVLIDRREKIESGQRTTSFTFLLNDKRGAIGKALSAVPPSSRTAAFMVGQLVYMVLTELPVVYLLYNSALWSGIFLIFIFAVSVWNGGGFYIEVFGRKYVFCRPLVSTMMSDCVLGSRKSWRRFVGSWQKPRDPDDLAHKALRQQGPSVLPPVTTENLP
jgi:hypothetical protein